MLTVNDLSASRMDVPRYTSYPTAAEFSPDIGPVAFREALREAAATPNGPPLSLYVHLPFCRQICHFCGCHALVARTPERIARYVRALASEAAAVAPLLQGRRLVGELHFGGGSPSLLEPDDFEQVMTSLHAAFPFAGEVAMSLEADPRTTDLARLQRYRALGVRRLSFGFQDLDDDVQHAIGRHQSAAVAMGAYEQARAVGFDGINIDLCYGLPQQTAATFARTIDQVIALRPDRIAVFGYAHVPWLKPQQKLISAAALPRRDLRLQLMAMARGALVAAGYRAIGLDHFALPDDDLARAADAGTLNRNFQGYTTTTTDVLIGLGLSAISDLPRGYFQNQRTLAAYYRATDAGQPATERGAIRTADDVLRGAIIRDIMCRFRLDFAAIERRFGLRFPETFAPELAELAGLQAEGLLELAGASLTLTPLGAAFVRRVAAVFDAHRRTTATDGAPRFSSAV
jgi:oxygen-independent coproporphyrinogen-3 oxidase